MRRKLIKQGNDSFTITLPVKWVREEKLQDGEDVELSFQDSNLVVSNPKKAKAAISRVTVDLKNYTERTINNVLNQSYRNGYDEITLLFKNKEQLETIKKTTRETLLGFEIIDENEKTGKCTIQNIAEPTAEKFDVILRKVFLLIKTESNEILTNLKNQKLTPESMDERTAVKSTIDNYTNFCRRVIIKERIGGPKNSYLMMVLVSRLSLIYHAYYYMYKFAVGAGSSAKNSDKKKNKQVGQIGQLRQLKLSNECIEILEKTNNMSNLLYETFYNKDINKAHEIILMKDKLIFGWIYDQLQKTKGPESVILYHAGEIIRLIHMASTVVFGMVDDKNKNANT